MGITEDVRGNLAAVQRGEVWALPDLLMEHFPGTENAHPETGWKGFLRVCSYDRTLVRSSGSKVKNELEGKGGEG